MYEILLTSSSYLFLAAAAAYNRTFSAMSSFLVGDVRSVPSHGTFACCGTLEMRSRPSTANGLRTDPFDIDGGPKGSAVPVSRITQTAISSASACRLLAIARARNFLHIEGLSFREPVPFVFLIADVTVEK